MPHITFQFPGGRYHATPWGSHVNEGLIEWPPSPWRLCRALIATGYSKLSWSEAGVPEAAYALLRALADIPPIYRLPSITAAHSRHYMPIAKGRTTKIFDTFGYVGDQKLAVSWNTQLDADQEALLKQLTTSMGYLGRAESWVTARLVDENELPKHPIVEPTGNEEVAERGWESVALISPARESQYATWRESALLAAITTAESSSAKALTPKRRREIESMYPSSLWGCLTTRTDVLQKQGWSQPPGSRMIVYRRPAGTVSTSVPPTKVRSRDTAPVECALFALASNTNRGEVLPRMIRALPQAELLHRSLVGLGERIRVAVPPEILGLDEAGSPLRGHRHAHYIPLDLDSDGRLDHFLVHATMKLGHDARLILQSLRRTWAKGDPNELHVSVVGLGNREDIRATILSQTHATDLLALATHWESATPFIAPRHLKRGRNSLEGQIRSELEERGFPDPSEIIIGTREDLLASGFLKFVRARRAEDRQPPSTRPWFIRIRFDRPVPGPIAIGYACHYGLGVFRPSSSTTKSST